MTLHRRNLGGIVCVLLALSGRVEAKDQGDIIRGEVGKEYRIARRQLIREGNSPVRQCLPNQSITGLEELCSMYPEVWTCFVDQPFCRFEWRSRGGKRFYIITNREDPITGRWTALIVSGWEYD